MNYASIRAKRYLTAVLGRFLLVDPDFTVSQLVATGCREFRATDVVDTYELASGVVASRRRLVALITEVDLPDGDGLELVRRARRLRPLLPILVLTSRAAPELINRAHALRAEYHCKPTHRSSLRGFLRRAVAFERVEDERITWAIDEMASRHDMTAREVELLVASVAGVTRKTLADELGISENTLKTQVRGVLRKCEVNTLEELGRVTLRMALSARQAARESSPTLDGDAQGPPSVRSSAHTNHVSGKRTSGVREKVPMPANSQGNVASSK